MNLKGILLLGDYFLGLPSSLHHILHYLSLGKYCNSVKDPIFLLFYEVFILDLT